MRYKTRTIIALILISIIAMTNVSFANSDISHTEMAEALDTLSILKGDGADYNFSGQLKRSEAVAFLVRLLGVEKKVIEDKDRYINDSFTDVESTQWYSYYIGYVTSARIVDGFDDGTFKPNKFVSEKEFIKMILGALNYKQGLDYEWNSIYNFGYKIGLLDKSYKNKEKDNKNFTREDAIVLMYNCLSSKINKLDITMTEKLMDRQIFTVEQAIEAGILVDSIKSDIDTLNVLDDTNIKVLLTEEVKPDFEEDNVIIYEADDKSKKLDIKKIKLDKDLVTITTDKQVAEKKYTLEILKLEDKEGFKTLNIKKDFEGYVDKFIESNFFKISKVKAISKNVINVYFTHPITLRATLPKYYTIRKGKDTIVEGNKKNLGVSLLGDVNNGVSLFLRDTNLEEGIEYTIDIDGDLSSSYYAELNEGDGECMSFIGTRIANEVFQVDDVEIINDKYILVTFNKEVDLTSASNKSNYILKDERGNNKRALGAVIIDDSGSKYKKVKLRYSGIKENSEYELKIDGVYDSFNQMNIEDVFPLYSYIEDEINDIEIDYAYAENQHTLVVYFNKPVPEIDSAKYRIKGASIETTQYDYDEPEKVTIYTSESSPLRDGVEYDLKITSITDEFGDRYNTDLEYTFDGTQVGCDYLDIVECKFISENKVYVEFDKNIEYSKSLASGCKLEYTKNDKKKTISASSITYVNDKAFTVKFSNVSDSYNYKLRINNIRDYSDQFTFNDISKSVEW